MVAFERVKMTREAAVERSGKMNAVCEQSGAGRLDFPFSVGIEQGQSPHLYHWHDEVELVYLLRGPQKIGMHGQVYCLEPGDMLLIPSGEAHCFFTAGAGTERLVIRFSPRLIMPLPRENREGQRLLQRISQVERCSRQWPQDGRTRVREMIARLYTEQARQETGYQLAVRGLIFELALTAVRELPGIEAAQASRQSAQDDGFKRTLSFLMENYTRALSLKDCAEALGFNMNYFSRFFRVHTGINFHEYLTLLRVRRAEWLLVNTDMSIAQVVGQSGFQNVKTFNRVFKKAHDCSPREYRQQKAC